MLSKRKLTKRQELIAMSQKPFDDILEVCKNVSKEWGDDKIVSIATIEAAIETVEKNTRTMRGKELKTLKSEFLQTLKALKEICNKKAEEMGRKTIPMSVLKTYIEHIQKSIAIGAGLEPLNYNKL